jgi:hypothetical protein
MESVFSLDTTHTNHKLAHSSCQTIEQLYQKYEDDLYITSKIHHYISQQLPTLLENIRASRERSLQRNEEHTTEQIRFMQQYLSQQKFYYHVTNETYFQYDGVHYRQISEEDILHDIVTSISEDKNPKLMNWKHKTKVSILKRIKDSSILKSIPESETIQRVLAALQPYMCADKEESKYFLTVLGDNILKKNPQLIHFVSPRHKDFLKLLNEFCIATFNVQCTQTFKYKYHEKHYEQNDDCRLVPFSHIIPKDHWYDALLHLDVLCVALHYSHKYGSSDDYLTERVSHTELPQAVFQLKHVLPIQRMNQFCQEYLYDFSRGGEFGRPLVSSSPQEEYFLQQQLQTAEPDHHQLSWKQIQYLWNDYLTIHHLPQHLYSSFYKKMFVESCYPEKYDESSDTFSSLGSSQIPLIQKFLTFWDETVIEDGQPYAELEMEEIATLFRRWLQPGTTKKKQKYLLKESKIMDILAYFHPELEMAEQKYVYRVRNLLWDKDMDIENAMSSLREIDCNDHTISYPSITLYDAYLHYCKFHSNEQSRPLLVSKVYFEKYMSSEYQTDIDENDNFRESWFRPL